MFLKRKKKKEAPVDLPVFDGRVPAPDFVNIETTRYCNLKCRMCIQYHDGTTVSGPHIDNEAFDSYSNQLFPFATRFQPSVSGEPVMSKGFERMLEKAERYGVKIDMCTNATLINDRMRSMVIRNLGRALISFDGATKETFEFIREGADFDKVCESVKKLCDEARAIPLPERPVIGFGCVLMRENIESLSELVELAHDLGVEFVGASHVHPVTEEMKKQSLVHFRDLAISQIDRALKTAKRLSMPLMIQPLDQLIAFTATSDVARRAYSVKDGCVEGLHYRDAAMAGFRDFPRVDFDSPDKAEIRARRHAALTSSNYVTPHKPGANARRKDTPPIWVCDYLWNKTYAALDGNIRPCCVPGIPNLGNLETQSFEEIWNGKAYTQMRLALVQRKPLALCRGCQHIREITDGDEIDRWLQGRLPPEKQSQERLSALLATNRQREEDEGQAPEVGLRNRPESPILSWEEVAGAENYWVEFSIDGFHTIEFSSLWHDERIPDSSYALPEWVWKQAPSGVEIQWRAKVRSNGKELEVGWGNLDPIG